MTGQIVSIDPTILKTLGFGVGGIFVLMVLHTFLKFIYAIKEMKNGNGNGGVLSTMFGGKASVEIKCPFESKAYSTKEVTDKTSEDIRWLKEVHSRFDPDGHPVWYFPKQELVRSNILLESILIKQQAQLVSLERIEGIFTNTKKPPKYQEEGV